MHITSRVVWYVCCLVVVSFMLRGLPYVVPAYLLFSIVLVGWNLGLLGAGRPAAVSRVWGSSSSYAHSHHRA